MDCKARNIYCAILYANTATLLLLRATVVASVMLKLIPDRFQRLFGNRLS